MRKRALTAALALALLAGGVCAAHSAGQSETLVSLSYLTGVFWNDLQAAVKQETDRDTSALFTEAAGQAGSTFASQSGINGDILSGTTGSGLVWAGGTGLVRSGALVDATAGRELPAGGILTAGHRYLAGTDVVLAVASSTAAWMAEGCWTVAAGDPVAPPVELPFADVAQDAWYYADVSYVYQNGLFNGVTGSSFAPSGKMQRCMMTTVLHRLAGEPSVDYSPLFVDIPNGQWYTAGTIWAGRLGVVTGVGDGRFDPGSNVTRQEIAVILHRYAVGIGLDAGGRADLSRFPDAGSVAAWGRDAIAWAVDAGILNGNGGSLLPGGDATRAEVAAMLHRFADWSAQAAR